MNNDLKLILTRLQQHFQPRRNTRYWVQIVLDPYDHAFNFFFNQQKRQQRLKSIPLHTITGIDLAALEKIVTALQARFQFTIDYVGFTGLRWPQTQTLIQRKKFLGRMRSFDQFSDARVQHFFDQVYHDRGLMKWQGFYLSDHTAALKQVRAAEHQQLSIQPQQSVAKITQCLAVAYRQHLTVIVQLNQLTAATGTPLPAVKGIVQGYHADTVYIGTQPVALALIRYVQVV